MSPRFPSVKLEPKRAYDGTRRQEQADLFRAAVEHKGVLASDALQVWLDVSNHPSRGKEQADRIRDQVLSPLLSR